MTRLENDSARSGYRPARWGASLIAAAVLAMSAPAWAFIPPASFIFEKVTGKLSANRGVIASLQGKVYSGAPEDPGLAATGRLYLASPDRFRLETDTRFSKNIEIWTAGTRSKHVGSRVSRGPAPGIHPLASLFVGGNPRANLRSWGVETALISLGRFRGHLCWVIGSRAGELSRPQIWVDKDTFRPVRLVVFEGEGEDRKAIEWRMDGYPPVGSDQGFPRAFELRVDGKLSARWAVLRVDVHSVPRESLFPTFTGSAPAAPAEPEPPRPADPSPEAPAP